MAELLEQLTQPKTTIAKCRKLRYVDADVATAAAEELKWLREVVGMDLTDGTAAEIKKLQAEIDRLRAAFERREAQWHSCRDQMILVFGNCFVPSPLKPELG